MAPPFWNTPISLVILVRGHRRSKSGENIESGCMGLYLGIGEKQGKSVSKVYCVRNWLIVNDERAMFTGFEHIFEY
jgi:hypothetical protein